ncbi:hypothetical protein [Streptomyces sp. NRRL F-5135]|uniref:hypothetical protein n=1 Tax=Streptomyces sp. NRRL F-5135 TaxID=1463858 RepID=UPI0004CB5E1A|nr:hypothetical protein [Streptomyces sp. NRRL F-5135]
MSAEKRRAAVERLSRLREDAALTAAHVRTVADALEVSERTVWRWLAPPKPAAPAARPRYELSDTDRAGFAFYRGNVAALARARHAVTAGDGIHPDSGSFPFLALATITEHNFESRPGILARLPVRRCPAHLGGREAVPSHLNPVQ